MKMYTITVFRTEATEMRVRAENSQAAFEKVRDAVDESLRMPRGASRWMSPVAGSYRCEGGTIP